MKNEHVEDQLRSEIIDQGRKMNELRAEHEAQILEISTQNMKRIDQLELKFDAEKKR